MMGRTFILRLNTAQSGLRQATVGFCRGHNGFERVGHVRRALIGRIPHFDWLSILCIAWMSFSTVHAAERYLDFSDQREGSLPVGWTSMLVGAGAAPRWEIVMREMPTVFTPLTDKALIVDRRPVLGQLAQDKVDERFPLFIYEEERFGDFTARVRMQLAEGDAEQLAGLVFRLQDDRNFYVLRLSALGGNVRFYKVVNGERGPPIGRNIEVKRGEWYELKVRCRGNQIQAWLNGEEVLPTLTDSSFLNGRIGFMTKSDTVAYFSDLHVDYRPLKSLATVLVEETLELYPRLLNMRMIGRAVESGELEVLAAKNEVDIGKPAGSTERKVFEENQTYYQRTKPAAIVTAPVRDRNGDVLGVVEFHVQRFAGQTESTTLARVLPIVSRIQQRIGSAESLAE